MEYRKFDKTYIVRIDRGEEILEQVRELALKEGIRLASVQALGAVNEFTVGVFRPGEKRYDANVFQGSSLSPVRSTPWTAGSTPICI